MNPNPFSHIDLRVNSLERALPFYEQLLPALGFTRTFHASVWRIFAGPGELPSAPYFGIMEAPGHVPNDNLIGFWAASPEAVDRIARLVETSGGKITDGPRRFPISPSYYAVYFEDPCGNKYEYVHRLD